MSTLQVNTIRSTTASTPPVVQDSNSVEIGTFCRAWVNFNGTGTVAIRNDFNVTSITDNGTGDYTVNITNALIDGNYSVSLASVGALTNEASRLPIIIGVTGTTITNKTGSAIRVGYGQGWANGLLDTIEMNVTLFR